MYLRAAFFAILREREGESEGRERAACERESNNDEDEDEGRVLPQAGARLYRATAVVGLA